MTKPRKRKTTRAKNSAAKSAQQGSAAESFVSAKDDFLKKLASQPHVKFLTKEESEALIANTEFDGCIARPKTGSA